MPGLNLALERGSATRREFGQDAGGGRSRKVVPTAGCLEVGQRENVGHQCIGEGGEQSERAGWAEKFKARKAKNSKS